MKISKTSRIGLAQTAVALLVTCLGGERTWADPAPPQRKPEAFPIVAKTLRQAPVHHNKNVRGTVYAKTKSGAILKVRKTGQNPLCLQGWFERFGGGFICGKHLEKATDKTRISPEEEKKPRGEPYRVTRKKTPLFANQKRLRKNRFHVLLRRGSAVMIDRFEQVEGVRYGVTGNGAWIQANRIEPLPPAQKKLGVDVTALDGKRLVGIAIDDAVPIHTAPDEKSAVMGRLARWETILDAHDSPATLDVEGAFVLLPGGGYVKDSQLARVRLPAWRPKVEPTERWIAVDIVEQLLLAFEGDRLVRVIPCSTGIEDNTDPGRYRIRLKRRMQTLRMYRGAIRVEDVPNVMYFHIERGLAIHSAYWHRDFGVRRSHGCVNLPPEDAAWVFDWTEPTMRPEDAEVVIWARKEGTKVLVYRVAETLEK